MTTPTTIAAASGAEVLLPCPFCGAPESELMLCCDPEEGLDNSGPSRRIQCAGCNIEAPFYDTESEAIAAWNRRAPTSPAENALGAVAAESIKPALVEVLCDAMDCTRDWAAWSYGTMTSDDFIEIRSDPDRLHEIAEHIAAALSATPSPQALIAAARELPEVKALIAPPDLLTKTFAVQYNPNCPSPWLVRLIGKSSGHIDLKAYSPFTAPENRTADILGFGKTFDEAARAALSALASPDTEGNAS
jgi:Lar family restriction alleviation protein